MGKRGSTPTVRSGGRHPPITRTTSVGLHSDPKNGSSQRLNGFPEFGSNPSLYPGSTNSMDRLELERTSSLGKLTENKPYHSMTMKTISETQLGGMFSDEDLAPDQRNEPHTTEELCSIDESLTSDDCSTQGSDTQITNSEIIDAAATAINKSASPSLKSERSLGKNLSPPKSPNISPLHHKLQSSPSTESREGLQGASVSPTLLTTLGNSPSHLKSILRSPSNSITSLSSISPTHTSFHTPPMPSTPTSVSADRAHSTLLLGGSSAAHSHTIVPTSNSSNDPSKNEKSPSPSPSMELEVVTCKTVVGEGQLLSPRRELHSRSNSDTSVDSMRGGLQFHVTFVNDGNVKSSNISTLIEEETALESTERTMSPGLLSPNDQTPMLIIRQSSDSSLMSPRQVNTRPHKVMFSECMQIRSFDSESDIDDKITIVNDDLSLLDLTNAESETIVNGHTTSEVNGLPESPSDERSQVSDELELVHELSDSQPQHMTHTATLQIPTASSATDSGAGIDDNEKQKHIKQSVKAEKADKKVPPAHKRVTGKSVRALSQMFEGNASPSSTPPPPVSSKETSPVHQSNRKVSVSKIPLPCDSPVLGGSPRLTKNHPNEVKSPVTRNNLKSSKLSSAPPKMPLKSTKAASTSTTGKQKKSPTPTPDQSPATAKRVTPARKNSVYQQRSGVSAKSPTSTATRKISRVEHNTQMSRHTTSPAVTTPKKQPLSRAPVTKPKPTRNQAVSSGKEHPNPTGSPKHVRASRDTNASRSKLQRQPSVASSRSPSPYSSSAQAGHKPLSRLSGTRQPLRRKSNNSSPAEIRRNNQHLKPVADGLNSNSNNNNNSSFDKDDLFALSAHFPDGSLLYSRRNESSPTTSPNSLQKTVRFSFGSSSNEGSMDSVHSMDKGSCHLQSNSAARGEGISSDQTVNNSKLATQLQSDDRNEMFKSKVDEFRYHHSLQPLSLRHANKRSPLEWKNFGLSWKQNSFPEFNQTGLSQKGRVLTNSRTTIS